MLNRMLNRMLSLILSLMPDLQSMRYQALGPVLSPLRRYRNCWQRQVRVHLPTKRRPSSMLLRSYWHQTNTPANGVAMVLSVRCFVQQRRRAEWVLRVAGVVAAKAAAPRQPALVVPARI